MTKQKKTNVQIDGRNFTIVGEGSPEHIKKIASQVDGTIKELSARNDKLSQTMTATLAALHIAENLYQTEQELEELKIKAEVPLEKYDGVCEKLEESKAEIVALNNMSEQYQKQITAYDSRRQDSEDKLEELKEELKNKDIEMEDKDEIIKTLQDKNFKNQLEIVDVKKELSEYLKLLDEKTSFE